MTTRIKPRQSDFSAMCSLLTWLALTEIGFAQSSPWLTNPPIASIQKELYVQHSEDGEGVSAVQWRAGPGLQRIEYSSIQSEMRDIGTELRVRTSSDNGQTWSPYQVLPDTIVDYSGVDVFEGSGQQPTYDPQAGVLIQPWIRQMHISGIYHTFAYYRLSQDFGVTWSTPKQLKYEAGADFDPLNPTSPNYINHNEGEYGQNFALLSNGKLVMGLGHASNPSDPNNNNRSYRLGYLDFIGQWNPTTQDYDWTAGERNFVSTSLSRQGMGESTTVQLTDGRVMNLWRGMGNSNTPSPGRSWFTVSNNDGLNLGALQELKYDDGTGFYSPAAQANLIRLASNGKLYWIGNISPTVTYDGLPRYPLVIGEVDENLLALKKNTITMIDTLQQGQAASLELSNFSWVEDPITNKLEIYLTNWGNDASNEFNADAYRYTLDFLNLPEPPQGIQATWKSLGGGTFNWNSTANWDIAEVPDTAGDIANLNVNVSSNTTINLNQTVALRMLNVGDTGTGTDRNFTINTGSGGSGLVFDNGGSNATLTKVNAGGTVTINSNITIAGNGNLDLLSTNGRLDLRGAIVGDDEANINFTGSGSDVHIYGDISGFTGTYNLELGGSTVTFQGTTPASQDGSQARFHVNGTYPATLRWAEDTVDTTPTVFKMGELSGNGYLRNQGAHPTTLQIGFLNTDSEFSGMIANGGQPPTLPGSPAEAVSLEKVGSGTLTLSGANIYQGATKVTAGTLLVNGWHIAGAGYTVAAGATLGGDGDIDSNVVVNSGGQLAPGASIGTFTTSGANIDGTLAIEFGGNTIDKLVVDGILDIASTTLNFIALGNMVSDEYIFATYDSLVGANFASIQNLPSSLMLHHNTTSKYFSLIGQYLLGDHNGDGQVDTADFVVWRNDPTGHGGAIGYDEWRSNFGVGTATGNVAAMGAIPEPTTFVQLAACIGLVVAGLRRHRIG
ncbi:MAG: autotransporter-associated beta strand repeat-containing protein [Pirellulales bacterium]